LNEKKNINEKIKTGKNVFFGENCTFEGLKGSEGTISFGDNCSIRENCRFYIGDEFSMGDYGVIHRDTLIQGYKPCKIGHNAWIGQNSIINATSELIIGNNCGIGIDSKIWTHAFYGELLLGCRIAVGIPDFESRSGAVKIGDDFWGIGQITISPGIEIGKKVIALTNSVITKNIPDNTIVGGIPARPIAIDGDFKAYKDLNEGEKYELMKKFAIQFSELKHVKIQSDDLTKKITLGNNEIIINCSQNHSEDNPETTYFDVIKRTYTKKHHTLEKEFMNFILSYRARFVPE